MDVDVASSIKTCFIPGELRMLLEVEDNNTIYHVIHSFDSLFAKQFALLAMWIKEYKDIPVSLFYQHKLLTTSSSLIGKKLKYQG